MSLTANLSIKQKLVMIIMSVSVMAIALDNSATVIYKFIKDRAEMADQATTVANIIGNNAAAAIVFDDKESAKEILSALRAQRSVSYACLLRTDGSKVAEYKSGKEWPRSRALHREGKVFLRDHFCLFHDIYLKEKKIGALYLEIDLGPFYDRFKQNFIVVTSLVLFILILSFLVASRLQRMLSDPILQLAQTTKKVSQTQDYSIQVQKKSNDEIGVLFDGFNLMMKQVNIRDMQLLEAKKELEQRVEKRTKELKKSNEELTQLLSLHSATLEATADGILVVDREGRIVSFNHRFLELWGIPDLMMASGNDSQVINHVSDQISDPEEFIRVIQEHYAHPDQSYTDLLTFRDGRCFERFSHPQKVGDSIVGRVWSFHDITNRKKAQEELRKAFNELKSIQAQLIQSEKMASIGQLAAGVAHEINNPVGFIGSNMEILGQYISEYTKILRMVKSLKESIGNNDIEKAKSIAQEITRFEDEIQMDYIMNDTDKLLQDNQRGIERIRKIVLDLKTFSHEGSETMDVVRIEDIIDGVVSIVHNEIKYKAELIKNYGNTPKIKCSPQRIGQVFINLLVNASHAIEDKGTIEIKTYSQDKYIGIDVSDTGKGIPKEHLYKIFEPFFTTKPVGKGTGLGLSVSYEILKKHGGDIKVESEIGRGTTFTVLLPIIGPDHLSN